MRVGSDGMRLVTGVASIVLFPVSGALYVTHACDDAVYGVAALTALALLAHAIRPDGSGGGRWAAGR